MNVNSIFLFVLMGVAIVLVVAQSVFFLIRAWRRAREIGMDMAKLKKVAVSCVVFTIAPAVSILMGVLSLSKFLGLPLPWFRLSILGSLTYELTAATTAASAIGASIASTVTDPQVYGAIAWVMTLGIIPGIFIILFALKKINRGVVKLKGKDEKWGAHLMSALFLGMISAFLGVVFADVRAGLAGWIPVAVMVCSALLMGVCGLLVKVCKIKWVEDFALPISMLGAMALSIPITALMS